LVAIHYESKSCERLTGACLGSGGITHFCIQNCVEVYFKVVT
jgi:hypothetical protein